MDFVFLINYILLQDRDVARGSLLYFCKLLTRKLADLQHTDTGAPCKTDDLKYQSKGASVSARLKNSMIFDALENQHEF
jgi:hypothetical protein